MKLFKYLLPLIVAVGFASNAFATLDQDGSRFLEELNERDWEKLYDFINTKRTIDLAEKDTNLTISGDVRTEWRHLNEKGVFPPTGHVQRLRGSGTFDPNKNNLPISRNDFDIEFNLRFDYVCDRAWAVAHVQYDNSAGVDDNGKSCEEDPKGYHGSGFCDDLCLKKAYWGYNLCCDGSSRFDIEVGRRNLYNVFDSKIQFLSRFDGILLKYTDSWECVADLYLYWAGFVVDERVNHFAWVTEFGFLNIADTGFDFKYSFIDWAKRGRNRCLERNPIGMRFRISQFTFVYHFDPEILCVPAKLYGAFLWNHNNNRNHLTHGKRENLGWYVGFTVGEVVEEGDWAFDLQYQVVQAEAIPDDDVSGIGRGNVLNESFTQVGRGNTNYKGWRLEGLYALTDNLTIDSILEWSRQETKSIGGRHHYSKFEVEAIYAF